jgi:hypothetical protein
MAATDLVPCFYTGQDYRLERPAEVRTRAEVREFKVKGLGKFIDNGKLFLFFKALAKKLWDGPLGIGNLLPFAPSHNYGEKLHYDVGPKGLRRHNLYRRKDSAGILQLRTHIIHVSGRSAPELRPALAC